MNLNTALGGLVMEHFWGSDSVSDAGHTQPQGEGKQSTLDPDTETRSSSCEILFTFSRFYTVVQNDKYMSCQQTLGPINTHFLNCVRRGI